ncbi:MAG: oligosaccharide repeat unit polymerase [Flavobacteriaceae bacterium]|nr:oligosaccharide repeat unit polymerase [Flavobacteriaceae bacterium]
MMLKLFLLFIFSLYVLITGIKILKQNILFGGTYFFLYLYSIFAQIGYGFFPEISEFVKAYFGKEYVYNFYWFNFLSFITFYFLFKIRFPLLKKKKPYKIVKSYRLSNFMLYIFIIVTIFIYELFYLITNYNSIAYGNASDSEFLNSSDSMYFVFSVIFKFMAALNIILYSQWRLKGEFNGLTFLKKKQILFAFLMYFFLFIFIAFKIGSRTDILALFLGILSFEYLLGINKIKLTKMFLSLLAVGSFLYFIQNNRVNEETKTLTATILLNDYYPPAHMLYTSMGLDYIKPFEVLKSNISNTFVKINYPYLQQPITELINSGVANRSQGYAFYLFTEGFVFMGYFGFIYNAFMLYLGLSIWYRIQNSTNKFYNIIIISTMCTQFANIARTQSSYFYKDIYMFFLPILILIYFSSGLRPRFSKNIRH